MLNHFDNSFIFQPLKQKILLISAIDLTSTINKIYQIRIKKWPDFWLKTNWNLKSNDEAFFSWWFFISFLLYFTIYQSKNTHYRLTQYIDFTSHKDILNKYNNIFFINKPQTNRNKPDLKPLKNYKIQSRTYLWPIY